MFLSMRFWKSSFVAYKKRDLFLLIMTNLLRLSKSTVYRTKERASVRILSLLEQVKGVEPSYQAWEACVLPMNYTCVWFFQWNYCSTLLIKMQGETFVGPCWPSPKDAPFPRNKSGLCAIKIGRRRINPSAVLFFWGLKKGVVSTKNSLKSTCNMLVLGLK